MTIKSLPAAREARPRAGVACEISPRALNNWMPGLHAAIDDDEDTISIYAPIGDDLFGDGVTVDRIDAALRRIGASNDVTVNINSPGGDVFEGLAIYNRLREHKGEITVNVLGLAASAASFIAMAGDQIRIGRAAFMMVHNIWGLVVGNRHDLREIADWLEPFDKTLADIYAARTGRDSDAVSALLDDETWIGGAEAVEKGWADSLLPADEIEQHDDTNNNPSAAMRKLDVALAKSGMSRNERRALLRAAKGDTPSAVAPGTPSAADDEAAMADAFAAFDAAFQNVTGVNHD